MSHPRAYNLTTYRPPGDAGTALAALSPQMQSWVIAKVERGVTNREAARIAGYAGTNHVLDGVGYRCAHDPRVQAALFEQATLAMRASSAVAIRVIEDILTDPVAEPKDRLRAADMILSRTGFNSVSEQRITVDRQSDAQQIAEAIRLTQSLGLDTATFLVSHMGLTPEKAAKLAAGADITDAEFEVIDDEPDPWSIPAEVAE